MPTITTLDELEIYFSKDLSFDISPNSNCGSNTVSVRVLNNGDTGLNDIDVTDGYWEIRCALVTPFWHHTQPYDNQSLAKSHYGETWLPPRKSTTHNYLEDHQDMSTNQNAKIYWHNRNNLNNGVVLFSAQTRRGNTNLEMVDRDILRWQVSVSSFASGYTTNTTYANWFVNDTEAIKICMPYGFAYNFQEANNTNLWDGAGIMKCRPSLRYIKQSTNYWPFPIYVALNKYQEYKQNGSEMPMGAEESENWYSRMVHKYLSRFQYYWALCFTLCLHYPNGITKSIQKYSNIMSFPFRDVVLRNWYTFSTTIYD